MPIRVFVNGTPREIEREKKLSEFVASLELPSKRVAIEVNKSVVPKSRWDATTIVESDKIEIVHFVGGG